jgi:hypothetical protein
MSQTTRAPTRSSVLTFITLIAIGCSSRDDRLVELSRQSADRQAEQNRLVETNNRQVIEATSRVVEADAQGRKENNELHRQIELQRSGLNQQRDALEQERRQIAEQRNRDPIVAESIGAAAGLLAAISPLLVCLVLLRSLFDRSDEDVLADLLIEDLVAQQPLLGDFGFLPSGERRRAPGCLPSDASSSNLGVDSRRSPPADGSHG